MAAHYKSQTGSFIEFALDWEGMRSYQTREKFRILSGGEYKGRHWYGGYVMTLLHYAKTDNTELDEGVVDHILLNPYVGYRYQGAYTFDARLGYLQSLQRDRRTEEGWKAPKGGRLALSVSRWGVCLLNELYVGENMLPFWDIYGYGLYAGTPFYGTPKKIYNQTAVTYNRRFFNNTVGVSAGFYFHYDGVGLGLQQILKVSVNLQKPFTVPRNRRKGGKSYNFVKIYLLWQSQPTTPIPRRKPRTFSKRSFRSPSPKATRAYRPVSRPNPTATCISATPRASASTSAWPRNTAAKCNLRFDDTNPVKEDVEYVDSIKRDIRWLGFDWALERYASDYFDQLYDWAVVLIKKGLAYVDDQTQEEIRLTRGTVSEPGKESPWRNRSVEENLDLFERMKRASSPTARRCCEPKSTWRTRTCCSATRSCTASCTPSITARVTNGASIRCTTMRTASAIRSKRITHSICTLEFDVHRPLYDWFIQALDIYPSHQYEFARLNLTYTMMSKRRLLKLVQEGAVMGWDDPACRPSAPCAARVIRRLRCATSPKWSAWPSATT